MKMGYSQINKTKMVEVNPDEEKNLDEELEKKQQELDLLSKE
jgi:hypothetical protein